MLNMTNEAHDNHLIKVIKQTDTLMKNYWRAYNTKLKIAIAIVTNIFEHILLIIVTST